MLVSVIIPAYNHSQYLRERIDSVLNQTYSDFELIVLDDCSTDNSREIIMEYGSKFPDIIICFNETNSGSPFSQWNKGVRMAKGEFVWIAESDDSSDPHFLECAINEMQKSDRTGLVFCDSLIRNVQKKIEYRYSERVKDWEFKKRVPLNSFVENPIVNVSSVLFRKSVYINAGLADTTMRYCGDWFLYVRIFFQSDIINFPEPLNIFRLHKNSRFHEHYQSNVFLREKLKVYSYILHQTQATPLLYLLILKSLLKTLILRFMHILKVPVAIMPEIPRRPKKFILYE